jgi:hypothetical protein
VTTVVPTLSMHAQKAGWQSYRCVMTKKRPTNRQSHCGSDGSDPDKRNQLVEGETRSGANDVVFLRWLETKKNRILVEYFVDRSLEKFFLCSQTMVRATFIEWLKFESCGFVGEIRFLVTSVHTH